MSTLELHGIEKSYNAIRVLEHIDLQVAAGSRQNHPAAHHRRL
jgi:iron(III) transport system ATP-binding protein